MHNALFELTGLPYQYDLFDTGDVSKIKDIIRSSNFGGASVTIPLKLDVIPLLDEVDPAAKAIGAVNTIVRSASSEGKTVLTGYNTDYLGMTLALDHAGAKGSTSAAREAAMVIGGGGTARAAIYALQQLGYGPIYLVGRNKSKLSTLTESFKSPEFDIRLLSEVDEAKALTAEELPSVAIGTIPGDTPIDSGMREVLCALLEAGYQSGKQRVLLEMAYKPRVTSLMQLASNSRWTTIPGLEALVGQGVHQVSHVSI